VESAIHQSLLVSIQGKEDFGITNGSFIPAVVKNSPLRMIGRIQNTLVGIVITILIQGCLLEVLAGSKKRGGLVPPHFINRVDKQKEIIMKYVNAKTVAKKMRTYLTMSGYANKVEKLSLVCRNDLEKILPDYVSGGDISKVLNNKE